MTHEEIMANNYLHFENWSEVNASNEAELKSLLVELGGEIAYDKTASKYIWFRDVFEYGLALNFEPNFEPERLEDWGVCYLDWDSQGADTKGLINDHEIVKTLDLKPLFGDLKAQKELIISEIMAEVKRVFNKNNPIENINLDRYIDWESLANDFELKGSGITFDQYLSLEKFLLDFVNQNR